jgi:hypothetical protein
MGMTKLGFGQPFGGIMQTAFVVADIRASIDHFIRDCGAGPFFLLDHFLAPDQFYRGSRRVPTWPSRWALPGICRSN